MTEHATLTAGKKVSSFLLVEDDPDFAGALRTVLTSAGLTVETCPGVSSALAATRNTKFDVAYLDLNLQDGSGLKLLESLGDLDPLLAMICLTGRDDPALIVQAMRLGAMDYLVKPVSREVLLSSALAAAEFSQRRRAGHHLSQGSLRPTGQAPAFLRSLELLLAAAAAPKTTVLLTGEPGVGKEVAANLVHAASRRAKGPLVTVNAACFNAALMDSELFGHEPGAFTGAQRTRRGLVEQADGGTLFLDEIGELPLDLQGKLLRVLEGHPFRRVGGETPLKPDARIICATNRDLTREVTQGRFRADLLERLRVLEIRLPPLRERAEDIPLLAHQFVASLGSELGYPLAALSQHALDRLLAYSWPGNVRELRNVLERALVLSAGSLLLPKHLPSYLSAGKAEQPTDPPASAESLGTTTLEEVTRLHVIRVYEDNHGNLTRAAEQLGISRVALRRRLQDWGLKPVKT